MKTQIPVAVDYETFYDSQQGYSLRNMTSWEYCHDERFNAYMVAIAWEHGTLDDPVTTGSTTLDNGVVVDYFVGPPVDFNWNKLEGCLLLAHNASFDSVVTKALQEQGRIPDIPFEWSDTADMCAFLGMPRNLKGAMKQLLGREISKEVRANMDGKLPEMLSPEQFRELYEYGQGDAIECLELWLKFSPEWPEVERMISAQNRVACARGFAVNREAIINGIKVLKNIQEDASDKLPWVATEVEDEKQKAGSLKAFGVWLRDHGVVPPQSFKKDSPEFLDWVKSLDKLSDEKVRDEVKGVLEARVNHAGTVQHIARLETLEAQSRADGLVRPGLIYFGAHSGRFAAGLGEDQSGVKNVNMLNLPRKPVFGVDMRGMYIPRPGYKFVIFDYSQIEARASLWLAGDHEFIEELNKPGANLYGITAAKMGWCKPGEDIKHEKPDLYRLAKCCVLGLGYSMGANKFVDSCKSQGLEMESVPRNEWPELDRSMKFMIRNVCKLDYTNEKDFHRIGQFLYSKKVVDQWRAANARIVGLWHSMQEVFLSRAENETDDITFTLPSGRTKTYYHPRVKNEVSIVVDPDTGEKKNNIRKVLTASVVKGQAPKFFTGGKLVENMIQSLCRDVMTYGAVEIEEKHPSWKFCWSCYDEVIFEVPEREVDEALKEMPEIMCHGDRIKDWTQGLPLAVDGGAFDKYCK